MINNQYDKISQLALCQGKESRQKAENDSVNLLGGEVNNVRNIAHKGRFMDISFIPNAEAGLGEGLRQG